MMMIDALPRAKTLLGDRATMPIGSVLPWSSAASPPASRQRPTARYRSLTTGCSTASATGSKTCSANSRTGAASTPVTTDARTPSYPPSASPQRSSSGSDTHEAVAHASRSHSRTWWSTSVAPLISRWCVKRPGPGSTTSFQRGDRSLRSRKTLKTSGGWVPLRYWLGRQTAANGRFR